MCITPFPLVGRFSVACARTALNPLMVLPATPAVLQIPTSLECEFLTSAMVSNVDSTFWLDNKCFRVGQAISNVFSSAANRFLVLRKISDNMLQSDWEDFGPFVQTKVFTCREWAADAPKTWTITENSIVQFRASLDFGIGSCYVSFWVETRTKPFSGNSSGGLNNPPIGVLCNGMWNNYFAALTVPHLTQQTAKVDLSDRNDGAGNLQYLADKSPFLGNKYDEFQLTIGAMSCKATRLAGSGTFNINVPNASNNLIGSTFPLVMSPSLPFGYIARIRERAAV